MNFVFISPQFPKTYWNFCDRLKKNGFNVLALGDTPYHELSKELICSITESVSYTHLTLPTKA